METLIKSLRHAIRGLASNPGFTAVAILTLALGIGVNSAIFSVVNGILLQPLPYEESERLVQVWTQFPDEGLNRFPVSPAEYFDYREETRLYQGLAAYHVGALTYTGGAFPERLDVASANATLWPLLGVEAALGRVFLEDEDQPGKDQVVVLSHGLWQSRFGGDRDALGRQVVLDGQSYTILGVAPPGFAFPGPEVALWIPLGIDPATIESRSGHYLSVVGRLQDGVSIDKIRTEMSRITGGWQERFEHAHPMGALSLREQIVGDVSKSLWVLLGTVVFVLLIACANVAGLLLVRSESKRMEVAIRTALGASRRQVLAIFFAESGVLAVFGTAFGIGLAVLGIRVAAALEIGDLPRLSEVQIDGSVLAFTFLISLIAMAMTTLAPAVQSSRLNLNSVLRQARSDPAKTSPRRILRSGLVVAQIGAAVMLVIASGLMIRSLWNLQRTDPGFDSEGILTTRLYVSRGAYPEAHSVDDFYTRLVDKVSSLPGVEAVSHVDRLPLWQNLIVERFEIVSQPLDPDQAAPSTKIQLVDTAFFDTLGVEFKSGRAFNSADHTESARVVILNETLARTFFPDRDPVGQQVRILASRPREVPFEIVGVVSDVHDEGVHVTPQPTMYVAHRQAVGFLQNLSRGASLLVRTTVKPESLIGQLRQTVSAIDAEMALYDTQTLDKVVSNSMASQRMTTGLLSLFSFIAVALAMVGIYGLVAQIVTGRLREFGLRFALGASPKDVILNVLGWGLRLIGTGLVLGFVVAIGTTHVLSSFLFSVDPIDVASFAGAALLFTFVALFACYVPARRVSKISPMVVLRAE